MFELRQMWHTPDFGNSIVTLWRPAFVKYNKKYTNATVLERKDQRDGERCCKTTTLLLGKSLLFLVWSWQVWGPCIHILIPYVLYIVWSWQVWGHSIHILIPYRLYVVWSWQVWGPCICSMHPHCPIAVCSVSSLLHEIMSMPNGPII